MSQTEFGENLGVSRGVISNIDGNLVEADSKPLLLQQICKVYGANEEWLRTGEGEMFRNQNAEAIIIEAFGKLMAENETSFAKQLVSALALLTEEQWNDVERFCWKVVKAQQGEDNASGEDNAE